MQRPGEENRDLAQRFLVEAELPEISVHITLQSDLARQLLQRTCQGDLAHDLAQGSSHSRI